MPSKWVRIMMASCFTGSILGRMTLVHHLANDLNCLQSKLSRDCWR
jgi:hypothetical protein